MDDRFVDVFNTPTRIMSWGQKVGEKFDENTKEIIIWIPGNPGLLGFYDQFLETIYNLLGKKISVWTLSYAGHENPPNEKLDPFGIEHQVKHKIEFIKKYVPENVKIHLLGHSIGAFMCKQILRDPEMKKRIKHCYLLFPTLEHPINSWKGFLLTYFFAPLYKIVYYIYIYIFAYLPNCVQSFLLLIFFLCAGMPRERLFQPVLEYIQCESALKGSFVVAMDAMRNIQELDVETITENKEILTFYYGSSDGWVPKRFYYNLKRQVPGIDAELCSKNIDHGFVINQSELMAEIVAGWVMKRSSVL